jgi:hypothetical protein
MSPFDPTLFEAIGMFIYLMGFLINTRLTARGLYEGAREEYPGQFGWDDVIILGGGAAIFSVIWPVVLPVRLASKNFTLSPETAAKAIGGESKDAKIKRLEASNLQLQKDNLQQDVELGIINQDQYQKEVRLLNK